MIRSYDARRIVRPLFLLLCVAVLIGVSCFAAGVEGNSYASDSSHVIQSARIDSESELHCDKGATVALKVITEVEEDAELSYQWYRDSYVGSFSVTSLIEGANADTYYPETVYSRCDDYYCVVTNTAGGEVHTKQTNKVKLTVDLTVLSAPVILSESEDVAVNLGDRIVLCVRGECRDINVFDNNRPISCVYTWYSGKESDGSDAVEIRDGVDYTYGDNHSGIEFDGEQVGYTYYYCVCTCSANEMTESTRSRIITVYVEDTSAGLEELDGEGSAEAPYLIKDYNDIELVAELVRDGFSFKNRFLLLTSDMVLPADWNPIGALKEGAQDEGKGVNILPFSGNLDGGGHTITVAEGGKPLLRYVREATIRNLNVYGKKIAGYGLVDNYVVDYGTDGKSETGIPAACNIENVVLLSGSSTLKSGFIGGYASGGNTVNITNCSIESGVEIGYSKDESSIGSFGGSFNGMISGSSSAADVYGVDRVGGLIGKKGQSMGKCIVLNSNFTGRIHATGMQVGGIIGAGYGSESAPNTPVVTINNCFVDAEITGTDEVGGILGSEPVVVICWGNGTGGVQNSFFYGKITATGPNVGGIIGYYNSLDKYQTIVNNYYLDTCGATKGIGTLKKTITVEDDPDFGREDEFDPEAACSSANASAFADGTVLAKLNAGEGSFGNWVQGADYPIFSGERFITELIVTGYKELYYVGETLDPETLQASVVYSDGGTEPIDASELQISGFDSSKVGDHTVTAVYGPVSTSFKVKVLYDNPDQIQVSFRLLGDRVHAASAGTHTLKSGGLETWIDGIYTADQNMTVKDIFLMALAEKGLQHKGSYYSQYDSYYISGVQIPGTEDYLEEFTNGSKSGWMYTLNGVHMDVGVDKTYLNDGDEIVVHYTDDYTQESGSEDWGDGGDDPFDPNPETGDDTGGKPDAEKAKAPPKPGKVTLKKLTRGKKAFTVKWKKVKNASGYEVSYSLKKNFKNAKTKTVKGAGKTSLKVKKLKKKKTYYVRVRAYRTVNGKTSYGAWSKVKKVKTK